MEQAVSSLPLCFDRFEVDEVRRVLKRDGEVLRLKPKAFDLLVTLIEGRGRVLTKDELFERLWPDQIVEENNLSVHIAALRKALGERRNDHRFIVTVPGSGYTFVAPLITPTNGHRADDSPSSGVVNAGQAEDKTSAKKYIAVAAAILFVLMVVLVGGYLWRNGRMTQAPVDPAQKITIKRLTSDGKVIGTALSPDGRTFVFSHIDGDAQSLWLGQIDGGDPLQIRSPELVTYADLKFTPDASSVVYTLINKDGYRGAVYKIPTFGGMAEKIADDPHPVGIARSGQRIAYVRTVSDGGSAALFTSELAGGDERALAQPPDGKTFDSIAPAWSPDDGKMAVAVRNATGDYGIFTADAAGGSLEELAGSGWDHISSLSWLADGNGLIVAARRDDSVRNQLWYISYPSGSIQRLFGDLNRYGSLTTIAKDPNAVLAVQVQTQSNIWVAPASDLARAKQLTFGAIGRNDGWFGLRWLSNSKIAYTVQTGDYNNIWTMNADGGEQRQLIPSDADSIYPSASSDGRSIVFQSNRGGSYGIWRSNGDGTDLVRLTKSGAEGQADISPDGASIVYVTKAEDSGQLWRITADGKDPIKLADAAGWPQFSPDGRTVACGYTADGRLMLAILSVEGGPPQKVFELPRLANIRLGIHWTPDGRAVTYRDWTNGIWRQDLSGGEPRRLKGLPAEKLYAYDWSSDGKLFAYTRGVESRDVVLISNFR